MSMPIIPPFAVTASYQNSQFGSGSLYTPGVPSVFGNLVSPPSSGTAAEEASDDIGEAVGWTGLSAASEVELVTINGSPTGGTFTLEFGDQVTGGLAYNAAASAVATALQGLSSVPGATVNVAGTADTQTITLTNATGGTFTLTFGGQTTSALAYNAPATGAGSVQTALQALSSIGSGNALVTGSAGGPYLVTFAGTLAPGARSAITYTSSLTGSSPTIGIVHTHPGTSTTYTQNITVSGSSGGPYTVTFANLLADVAIGGGGPTGLELALAADGSGLTGGTSPTVVVTRTTAGTAGESDSSTNYWPGNPALRAQVQQYDPMKDQYDAGSGNHF